MFNINSLVSALKDFKGNKPFDHCVIDDFLLPEVAAQAELDFLDYDDSKWFYYKNAIEDKKCSQ